MASNQSASSSPRTETGWCCSLLVTFTASAPGPRTADLHITMGRESDQVQLDAPVPAGTTSLVMTSQPGDFVGAGRTWNFNAYHQHVLEPSLHCDSRGELGACAGCLPRRGVPKRDISC